MRLRTVVLLFVLGSARPARAAEPDAVSTTVVGLAVVTDDRGSVAHAASFAWRRSNAAQNRGIGFTFSFVSDDRDFSAMLACDGLEWTSLTTSMSVPSDRCRILIRQKDHTHYLAWPGGPLKVSVHDRALSVHVDAERDIATPDAMVHFACELTGTVTLAGESPFSPVDFAPAIAGCGSCSGLLVPAHG